VTSSTRLRTAPETRRWDRPQALLAVALPATPAFVLVIGIIALRSTNADDIRSLGLVDALPTQLYIALALLTATFIAAVFSAPGVRPVVLVAHIAVFIVLLHGAAAFVEPLPRFVPAWLHVGFADYIARTGDTLPELDARFSWPGFFALAAMATRAAGLGDALPLLAWTPVVFNLLYAALVHRVARAVAGDARTPWLAVWFFIPANWVGQDYFSPQGLNYVFYLVVLLVLLAWFRPSSIERARRRFGRRARTEAAAPTAPASVRRLTLGPVRRAFRLVSIPRGALRHEAEPLAAGRTTLASLIGVALLVFMASTASHQLTPTAILVSVTMLVAVRRCSARTLPVLLLVILLGYISYLTVAYWAGHLHDMLGSVGQLSHTVNAGIGERTRGDRGHLIVLQVRQLLAVGIWTLAGLGAWRLMRARRGDVAVMALAGAPFLLLFAQSYGGEVFLRIYTFSLPFMVVLAVGLLVPVWPVRRPLLAAAMVFVLSIGLTGAFLVARYGNESFERVLPGDVEAVDWLYANAAPGSTFVALTSNVPWRARDIEQYRYTPLGEDLGPDSVPAIERAMAANPRGAYLLLTTGQYVWGESFYGKPPGWGASIEQEIDTSGHFQLIYARHGGKIYILTKPRGER